MVRRKQNSGRVDIGFEVEDTGPGIRQEDRDRIFFPFVQLGERPPTQAGTGLGLAICKQYVALMGGTISVVSEPGKGSVFQFEIPVSVLSPQAVPSAPKRGSVIGLAEGQPRYRLLIAEDQPENRLLLRKLLEPLGFDLREAVNGQEAVAIFEEWRPDLVWMDIRMPIMDGLEAARRIKETRAGADTKIVAITAHAFEGERDAILAAGCDFIIRKPFKRAEIFEALTVNLGLRFIYEEEIASGTAPAPLDAAALSDLPGDMKKALEQALIRIDIGAINRSIEEIRAHSPLLADELAAVAKDLQFGRILRLIQAARGGASLGEKRE
jgi:CheY-like chemotaxis protein